MDESIISTFLSDLKSASERGRLVIFVGAGVSNNSGVPVWSTLINSMKRDLPEFAKTLTDDLKLAQIYQTTYPTRFVDKVKEVLKHGVVTPNPVHDVIFDLRPAHIITTNYDDLLEQTCQKRYEQYSVICADEDLPSSNSNKLLIKMHGDFEKGNIVLAEQNYYDYSRNFPLIRSYVMSLFASKTILFIGFSFDDINLKYILRELKAILQKKMQPVYLLTDRDMGHEQMKYLENQGINPICISYNLLDYFEGNIPSTRSQIPPVLTNPHGRALYRQLKLIRNFSKTQDPFVNTLESLSRYDDEFEIYGEYLRYIAPEYLQTAWHQRNVELNVDADWFQAFCKKDMTFGERLMLCRKYRKYIPKALKLALRNHIYYIGKNYEFFLFKANRFKRCVHEIDCDGVDDFYRMKLIEVYNRITVLSDQSVSLTKKDLELPYLYYKIGKYEDAFGRYIELADVFWEKRRYILYMICRINMRALANALTYNGKASPSTVTKASEIMKTELADILNDLPIDKGIRKVFIDIISNKMLLQRVESTSKICRNIELQNENARNGGFSWNNYPQDLLYNFSALVDFGNVNYIISDSFEYAHRSFCNIAKGLLYSLEIREGMYKNSRLQSMDMQMVILLLFHLRKDELFEVLRNSTLKEIPIEPDAKEYICDIVNHLVEYTNSDLKNWTKYYEEDFISNLVLNLCVLLCYLPKDCMPDSGLYLLIATYMRICDERDYVGALKTLVDKIKPATEEAEKVIGIYLNPVLKTENNPWLLSQLAKIIASEGKHIGIERDFSIYRNLDVISLAALRPALDADGQTELDDYVNSHVQTLYEALVIEMNSDCHVLDEQRFDGLLKGFLSGTNHEECEDVCYQLKLFYQDDKFEQFRHLIEPVIPQLKPLSFFLNPIEHANEMNSYWMLWLDDKQIRELINIEGIMPKIDAFCKRAYAHVNNKIKQRIWEALVKENIDG